MSSYLYSDWNPGFRSFHSLSYVGVQITLLKLSPEVTGSPVVLLFWKNGFSQNICSKLERDNRLCSWSRGLPSAPQQTLQEPPGVERVWKGHAQQMGRLSWGHAQTSQYGMKSSLNTRHFSGPSCMVRKSSLKQQQRLWECESCHTDSFPSLKSCISPTK